MRAVVEFFLKRHLLVNVIAGSMVIFGLLSATSLQREFIPSFDVPIVFVTATLPGASARDIETKVTIPIEDALDDVEGIVESSTLISDSVSFTTIEFFNDFDSTEIRAGVVDIRNAIDAITDFPPEMDDEPIVNHLNPARDVVIEIALSGRLAELDTTADLLKTRLERLSRVSIVRTLGLQDTEVRIFIDPNKALAHGITLNDVISAIQRRNVSSTGGTLESNSDQRQVVMWSRYEKPQNVGDTILKFGAQGGELRVKDIARVESGREDTDLLVRNDGQRGITLLVHKRATADIIDVVEDVRKALKPFKIPEGVSLTLGNDESFVVSNRLSLMATNGLMGAVLVMCVLLFFVRLQPAIWILLGIPVVFLGALALFGQTSMTLNMMSLTAFVIVLGMIVDDAVVVSERIAFKQSQGLSSHDAALEGTMEMMPAVIAAALTTILAFAPMIAMGGIPGKMIWQLPAVVVIALLISVIESFFILPAHMSTIRAGSTLTKRAFVVTLEKLYRHALRVLLLNRLIVVAGALLAFLVIMLFIRPQVPFILFPQDDATMVFVKLSAPLGTPLEQTEAYVVDIEKQVKAITAADLELVTSRVGHQNSDSKDKTIGDAGNEALVIAQMKQSNRQHTNAVWIQKLHAELRLPVGLKMVIQSDYWGPPTDQPVTVHVLANNDQTRRAAAYEIATYLRSIDGVVEVDVDERPGTPQLDLNLNYEKLALYGLDAATVGQTLAAAFHGIEASEHRDMNDTTKLRVMLEPSSQGDINALLDVPIRAADGSLVKLRNFVNPVENPTSTRIFHRDGYRSSTVRASFTPASGITALPFSKRMNEELMPRFENIPGLQVFSGGEASETETTTGGMKTAAMLAVGGIAIVIWVMLGSLIEATFILMVVPFAIAGVFLTFYLHGAQMSMFSMMGAIGLIGVVVNGAIVMVDNIHRRLKDNVIENATERTEHLIEAVVERLRPILVTTLTTLGGVLPTAYGIGGHDPIVSPMSLAIGWGLVFSTIVTLFVVPVLYSLAKDLSNRFGV
ncbi:MAG: efflux RND transporter permease subunit [Pseudomonadales bacterium]